MVKTRVAGCAPRSVIDPAARPRDGPQQSIAVNSSAPDNPARRIVFLRPFSFQHRFRFAVADLLLPKGAQSFAAMVPDHRSRTETQLSTGILQAPADIPVVTGDSELRVKPTDRPKLVSSKGHITAGNVFRLPVREKNVSGPSWCKADAGRDVSIIGKRNVRTTDGGTIHLLKRVYQIIEPVGIGRSVVVEIRNDFPRGRCQSGIAGRAQAAILRADDVDVVLTSDFSCPIRRSIINNNDLEIRITNLFEAVEALADRSASIERADHHRDTGRRSAPGERCLRKRAVENLKSGLCHPITVGNAEIPVLNVISPVMPLVRPGKDEDTSSTHGK